MNYIFVIASIVIALILLTKRESFGMAGYTKPVERVQLDDPRPDLSKYTKVETSVDNDMIEEFVLKANKEISTRTGVCTYIIETTSVNQYRGEEDSIFECMFMVIKNNGFSFGFSVVASFEVKGKNVRLIALRSQPLDVQAPSDITPFTEGSQAKEFVDYQIVKEVAVPTKDEFDSAKIKLQ
jgi:hypothetical protein